MLSITQGIFTKHIRITQHVLHEHVASIAISPVDNLCGKHSGYGIARSSLQRSRRPGRFSTGVCHRLAGLCLRPFGHRMQRIPARAGRPGTIAARRPLPLSSWLTAWTERCMHTASGERVAIHVADGHRARETLGWDAIPRLGRPPLPARFRAEGAEQVAWHTTAIADVWPIRRRQSIAG